MYLTCPRRVLKSEPAKEWRRAPVDSMFCVTIFVLILSLNIFTLFFSIRGETGHDNFQLIFLIDASQSPVAAAAQLPGGNTLLTPT